MISVRQVAGLAAAVLMGLAPASAQTSNGLPGQSQVIMQLSFDDVASMMSELGIASQLVSPGAGEAPVLLATTPGGGRFVFHFFGCENPAEVKDCVNTVVNTALPGAGYTFDDINNFNGSSVVTTAVYVPQGQVMVLGRNIIVLGGHSRELFKGTVYLFLVDVQKFADQKQSAGVVAFSPTPEKTSKINGFPTRQITERPENPFGLSDLSTEISTAIANTSDVTFSIDYKPLQ